MWSFYFREVNELWSVYIREYKNFTIHSLVHIREYKNFAWSSRLANIRSASLLEKHLQNTCESILRWAFLAIRNADRPSKGSQKTFLVDNRDSYRKVILEGSVDRMFSQIANNVYHHTYGRRNNFARSYGALRGAVNRFASMISMFSCKCV